MYSIDNPEKLKFTKARDTQELENRTAVLEGWSTRLVGKAKAALVSKLSFALPPQYQTPKGPIKYDPPKKKS